MPFAGKIFHEAITNYVAQLCERKVLKKKSERGVEETCSLKKPS